MCGCSLCVYRAEHNGEDPPKPPSYVTPPPNPNIAQLLERLGYTGGQGSRDDQIRSALQALYDTTRPGTQDGI